MAVTMTFLRATTVFSRLRLLTGLLILLPAASLQAAAANCPEGQDMIYFDPAPASQDVREGDDLLIRCDVSSRQLIVFYWTLNGKTLANTSRRFQENSDLRILRVSRNLDSGGFRCVAVNVCTGIALRSAEARLAIQWLNDQVAVKRVEVEENVTMSETKDVTLKCHVDSNPEPTFEWFRNRIKLFANDHFQLTKNRIKIVGVTTSDNGVYSCRARNAAGQTESLDNFVLNAAGDDSVPRLVAETFTRVVVARKYSSAIFDCQFEGGVASQWYLHNLHLANTTKYHIVSNGSLIINHVDEDDAGAYRCIGFSATNATISQVFTAELHLAYLNNLTESSFDPRVSATQPHIIPVGGKMEVRCFLPKGLPSPTSRWLIPSGSVPPGGGRIKESPDGVITITRVEEADAGDYVCQVENLAGIRSRSFGLVVSVTPRITKPPSSQSVLEGDRITMECRFFATPYPATTVSWKKAGQPIDSTNVRFHSNQGNLTITDVQVMDEGEYSCVVVSKGHSPVSSQSARLRVSKRLQFCAKPSDAKLELNSDTNVSCCADGTIVPDISWQKIGGTLPSHVRFDKTGILFFRGIHRSDAGLYVCVASNSQGAINATIRVDVVVKPVFTLKPGNVTTKDGVPVMLHCRASGEPIPTIRWDRIDRVEPFDLPRIKVLENGTLFISNVFMEDAGSYRCVADNGGGQVQLDVYLEVDDLAEDGKSENRMMRTIVIALCCAAGYLGIMIALLIYCVIRRMRRQSAPAVNGNGGHVNESTQLMFKKDKEIVSSRSDGDSRSQSSSQNSHQFPRTLSFHPVNDLAPFPRQNLQIFGLLGKCSYGDVMLAHNLSPGTVYPLVSVKSLMSPAGPLQAEFQREMELIARANHVNVARLIGICCSLQPPILIIEYCEWGDLKQFLMSLNTESSRVIQSTLSLAQQLEMVYQVARGMEHLSLNHLVHGDLAARNVLVTPSLDLKITSLSLSRDIHASDYFLFHDRLIPLRWMPAESVFNNEFSTSSDIWSFGVFVLEVFRFGALPLPGKANDEILIGLKAGAKLHCSTPLPQYGCTEGLWKLVQRCTSFYPVDRPSFTEIVNTLGNLVADSGV